ncbi:MAG TPA: hypothetical protein PLQ56_19390 [Aggregatilineales bacterium]|nr:hypothetical protein [Aggregatilineales bacterium]
MTSISTKPALLLVEGADDVAFFNELRSKLSLDRPIKVEAIEGKDNLLPKLRALVPNPNVDIEFLDFVSIGVVRDADEDPEQSFREVVEALQAANLPAPSAVGAVASNNITTSVFILPDASSTRMLEDLCLRAFERDHVKLAAQVYVSSIQLLAPLKDKNIPKATLKAFLACKEDTKKHEVRLWLGEAVKEPWWPWDHPAFDEVKAFVRQVANVTG